MLRAALFVFAMIVANVAVAAPFLYSLSYSGEVKIFDTATQTFVPNTIPISSTAVGFAVSPSGDRVYLSAGSTIVVIDSAMQAQMTSISVPACVSSDGQRVRVRPQNDILYFACDIGGGQFSLYPIAITGSTYTVQPAVITATGWPIGIAINATGTRMWIARWNADVLAVDDLLGTYTTTVIPAIVDQASLTDIAYNRTLNRVYVPTVNGVVPIDGSSNAPLTPIGSGPMRSVAVSNNGSRIYALDNLDAINAYDADTGGLIGPVTLLAPGSRMAIAVDPTTDNVIALGNSGGCSSPGTGGPFQVINANTLVAGASIPVPGLYCEPRAAGQIIMSFVPAPALAPVVPVPALPWYALILLGFGACLVVWASDRARRS